MASINAPAGAYNTSTNRRDRPWLLPSNRKLRNLVSISLRNLSLDSQANGRARGKTIDDDAVPQFLKSPAKIVAQREFRALEHSRSSEDLKTLGGTKGPDNVAVGENGTPIRPNFKRLRRRSTLEWANATPQSRQERLEHVTQERLADVFFSLHLREFEEPVYVSETAEMTMNPTFRHIDFSTCGPAITRLDHFILRVWVRRRKSDGKWEQLKELDVRLDKLQFSGKNLDQLDHRFSQNAVLFHLADGIYTTLANFIPRPVQPTPPVARANSTRILPTSSFDALLRLSKLDDSIQDALATRNKLAADLEALFESNKNALNERDQAAEATDRLKTIEYAKKTVEKQLEKARKQTVEKRDSLRARRELMQSDIKIRESQIQDMHQSRPELAAQRDEREIKRRAVHSQRRRICEDLQRIYPIHPIPRKSLAFTIRDLPLPNSDDLDTEASDHIAAALGYVAHILLLLSYYLKQLLPYPVIPHSSTSTISDPISLLKTNASTTERYKDSQQLRTYPLFSRGVPRFRFEYAVFLLNKDVQLLLETGFGVRVLDIRQTLPNLKYLLYVATAGEGELPARKAGGVRGLLKAKRVGPTGEVLERSGSESSMGSTLVGSVLGADGGKANDKGKGKVVDGNIKMNGKPKDAAVQSLKRNIGPTSGASGKSNGRATS